MKTKLLLLMVLFICSMHVYSQTTVFFNPATQTVGSGEIFTTSVEISQVSDLGAWEFKVIFDPNMLQASSMTVGSFISSTGNVVIPIKNDIDNINGILESAVSSFGANPGASGDGVIVNIEWTSNSSIVNTTTTDLILQDAQFVEKDATLIPVTLQDGSVTITGLLNTSVVSVSSCPGSVSAPINVTNFEDVVSFDLHLNYTDSELSYSSFENVNTLLSGVTVTENGSELIISYSGSAVTIGNGNLLELLFTTPPTYTQFISNLTWNETLSTYTDIGGIISTTYSDGNVTINPLPSVAGDITGSDEVCQGTLTENYQITAVPNATSYVWELNPSNAGTITGTSETVSIDFSATYSGIASLSVYGTNACGDGSANSLNIDVIPNPTANAGTDALICESWPSYTLSGSANDYQSVTWITAGDGNFDDSSLLTAAYSPGPADIASQSVTLTLTATAISPCATAAIDDVVINISYMATSDAGLDAIICEGSTHQLAGSSMYYSFVEWNTSGDGSFDNFESLTPIYTPGPNDIINGSAVLTLEATAGTPCMQPVSDDMTLTIQGLTTADAGTDDAVCETTPVYTLSGVANNETSILWTGGDGTFDDPTLLNATYTAGAGDLVTGSVTLSLTAYPNAPCTANAVDDMVLNYAVLPTADAGPDDEICLNTPSYQVAGATASNYTTVLWTTSGDGTFADATLLNPVYSPGTNDRTAGTVDLTMTASSVAFCDASDVMTLPFAVLPTADAGADASICEDATYMLTGTATDYSALLWTTSGDGSFDDATSLTAIYTPGTNDIASGTATLTLTSYASFPCVDNDSDDMVLNIGLLPIANAGADDEICLNTSSYLIAGATAANQSSVLWTTSGDGTFNNATLVNPTYTPGSGDIANFSVTLTMTANATTPCSVNDVDSMVLNFALLPTANAGSDGEVCESDTYMLSGSYQHASSVLWSTSGDGTFDDATSENAIYTPGNSDITNGNVDLTITAFAQLPCSNDATDVMTLNIMLLPIVDAGIDDAICASSDFFTTNGSTAGDVSTTLWTTSGDGTFDDATQLITNYNPGPNDLTNEVVTLTLTSSPVAPCANTTFDQMELAIQPTPTSNAGSDATICENETHTLNGSATNYDHVYWTTFGDGTFSDPFLMNATYTPGSQDIISGSVTLEMFAYSIVPCYGEIGDEMLLIIQSLPQANAGDNGETCFDLPYQLNGSADNYADVFWSTSGDGTFDDLALLNAIYTPGPNDIENGTVDITLTATPSTSACSGNATDIMTLLIYDYPDQPQIPEGPIAIDLDLITSSEYTIAEVTNAISYEWILEPATAGTIEETGLTGTAYWSSDYTGIVANIRVVAINDCGETASENLGISLSPVGIRSTTLSDAKITLAPNPSTGRFSVTIEGVSEEVDLTISNSNGQIVYQERLINTLDQLSHPVDISANPSGIYYLKFVSNDVVSTRKVIIN